MELLDWLNQDVKLSQKIFNVSDEFADFWLYGELFRKVDLMDSDDWKKFIRKPYEKKGKRTNYENTVKIVTQKMGLKLKVSFEQPNHESLLTAIK